MQQDRHPFAINSMLRSLRGLESFSRIPVAVPSETTEFVRSLLPLCDTTDKPLFVFVLRLQHGDLKDEILKAAVPPEHFQLLLGLRDEHERLAIAKETAVANEDFELGADCLDKQYGILQKISDLVPEPINITPFHLTAALKSLGFDGDLQVTKQ